jgi:hypothetical protein
LFDGFLPSNKGKKEKKKQAHNRQTSPSQLPRITATISLGSYAIVGCFGLSHTYPTNHDQPGALLTFFVCLTTQRYLSPPTNLPSLESGSIKPDRTRHGIFRHVIRRQPKKYDEKIPKRWISDIKWANPIPHSALDPTEKSATHLLALPCLALSCVLLTLLLRVSGREPLISYFRDFLGPVPKRKKGFFPHS